MAETLRIEIPVEILDETEPDIGNLVKKIADAAKKTDSFGKSVDRTSEKVTKFDKAAQKTEQSLLKWAKEKYEIALEAKEKITPLLSTLGNGLRSITGKTWNVTMRAVDLVTAPLRGVINLLKNPFVQAGATFGISFSFADTLSIYSEFEATMSQVKALADANEEEMARLTEKAKEMGAVTKYSGTESAEAFTYMAQAGWAVNDMVDGIGGIMSLAAADGLELAEASDIVASALTAFRLKASEASEFADVLAVAASSTNTDVHGLGEAFKYVAPVAGALKYSIQDTSFALGLMSNNAVEGSMAGTSLKTSLANMAAPTDKMAQMMQRYNISLEDSEGNMKTLKEVLDNVREGLGGLSESEQTAAASVIFGKEAMAGMLGIINTSEEDYERLAEAINNSEGAADRMAETMQDNLAGAMEQLGGAIETVQLSLGERIAPYIRDIAEGLADNMPAVEAFFDGMIDRAEDMYRTVTEMTSSDAWQKADFFQKTEIAWDTIIGQPFRSWWNTEGREIFEDSAESIGDWIGSGITHIVQGIFGDSQEAMSEGANIASAFCDGFLDGFDGEAVKGAIGKVLKGIVSDAFDGSSATSLLSKGALLMTGTKLLGGISAIGRSGIGSAAASAWSAAQPLVGSAAKGSGLLGFGANQAIRLGGGNLANGASLGAGALSALGLSAVAGTILGAGGLVSAVGDLKEAAKYNYDAAQRGKGIRTGATKTGMVGAGIAAGAAIGSVIPGVGTLIGAGIGAGVGGLGALIGGDAASNLIGDLYGARDRQQQVLMDMAGDLEDAVEEYQEITSRNEYAQALIEQYQELENVLNSDGLSSDDAVQVQERMQSVAAQLQELFPDLISSYDILNGKTGERIGLLKDEMNLADENTKRQLRQSVQDTKEQLPVLQENLDTVEAQLGTAQGDWETKNSYRAGLSDYLMQFEKVSGAEGATPEEIDAAAAELIEKANALSEELGQGQYYSHAAGIYEERDSLKDETQAIMDEVDELLAKKSELEGTLESYYNSSVQLAAADNGMSMESLLGTVEQINTLREAMDQLMDGGALTDEMKGGLNEIIPGFSEMEDAAEQTQAVADTMAELYEQSGTAIDTITELNQALEDLPEEKKIRIVTVTPDLSPYKAGFSAGYAGSVAKNAEGGMVSGAQLSWVGEDGPEAIIPLGARRRARGLKLWMQAGEMLGVGRHAEGAILGSYVPQNKTFDESSLEAPMGYTERTETSYGGVQVNLTVSPVFRIEGGEESGSLVEKIRSELNEITNELCSDMAAKLEKVFQNMPANA